MLFTPPIAVHQGGVFSRQQALDAGFTYKRIRSRLANGSWIALGPKAFHAADVAVSERGRIVAAALNTDRPISHWSAAQLHGIDVPASRDHPSTAVHVTSHRALHVNVPGIVEHRTKLFAEDITTIGGIAVTTRDRTVVDLLASLPRYDAHTLLFLAVQQGWTDQHALGIAVGRRAGRHGTPQLRELVGLLGTDAHAVSERILHELLDRAGIQYDANVRLRLDEGRLAVADVLLRGTTIVVEIDGRQWHAEADRFQRDRTRQNALVNAGFTVLRFTWLDLTNRPDHVVDVIRRQLAHRAA